MCQCQCGTVCVVCYETGGSDCVPKVMSVQSSHPPSFTTMVFHVAESLSSIYASDLHKIEYSGVIESSCIYMVVKRKWDEECDSANQVCVRERERGRRSLTNVLCQFCGGIWTIEWFETIADILFFVTKCLSLSIRHRLAVWLRRGFHVWWTSEEHKLISVIQW